MSRDLVPKFGLELPICQFHVTKKQVNDTGPLGLLFVDNRKYISLITWHVCVDTIIKQSQL